ncbi:MAG: ribbon-helix-helix protein, CopG family [Alphaproteobacteria bacterium]|nr:ribbon-helix-helix protein, CopG family [Alphaproteobacteria bacterium]MBU2380771.1 ribbon-helix-helix protein, CopG family [Alphaproteobacteria bacterium]
MTVHVTIPVDEAAKADLEELALARGVGMDEMMAEAVSAYIDDQRELLAAIDDGLADIEAERVIPHEQVVEEMRTWRSTLGVPE